MFTGLIEATGILTTRIQNKGCETFLIKTPFPHELAHGESVALNGCCLTVAEITPEGLCAFHISEETLKCTTLSFLEKGDEINLERSLKLGDRVGGHLVSGHVDSVASVSKFDKKDQGWFLQVSCDLKYKPFCIRKGSIALDGVSLTINELEFTSISMLVNLMLIPTTVEKTTFKYLTLGKKVNVELDQVGKYLANLAEPYIKR